jgi:hypothetical protein
MVDIFALAVSHGLLALAVWRLLSRDDLTDEAGKDEIGKNGTRGRKSRRPIRPGGIRPDA